LLAPAEVANRAARRGVDVLALTDHDEVGGVDEARIAAEDAGIRFIAELSVSC
jgi:predicted metal-dependent phosphoesterase TrpH